MAESPTSNQPLTSSAINIEENSMEKKSKKTFTCMSPGCTKIFAANYNLKRHMIKAHKINAISDNLNIKCLHPTCTNQFVHVTKMLTHLEDEHGVEIQREKLTFKTLDEFYKWKENEQTTNFVYFSKYQGVATPKDGDSVVLYFKCQRDGSNRPHRASGHTPKTNKTRGSVKMNMVCPARMVVKVSKNDGTVMVEYIQSHSHPITAEDSRRQPMPSSLREDIERKLSAGMTEDEIMTELTGGTYLPTGKQGDRSMKDRRGDRSSINYGIPVDSGIYFINKKRLSTMKRRLKVPITADPGGVPSGGPPAKKRKTVDEAALELAAIKGQLKQLSEYLDDEAVREAVLPDVHSLVTYLLQSCAKAKKGESLDASQESSEIVGGNPTVALQSVPYEQAASSQTVDKSDAEDSEPTVYFSDGKNVIKVAIKRRCKDGNKPPPVVSQPSLTDTSISALPVSLASLGELQTAVSSVTTSSVGTSSIIESQSTVTAPVFGVIDAQSSVIEVLPSGHDNISDAIDTQSSQIDGGSAVELVVPADNISVEPSALTSNPNLEEQEGSLEVNPGVEMIQVIEHYEQAQQSRILYNLPTEGAYVTVCDVDGVSMDGGSSANGAIVNAEAQQDGQASASILLNAIMAANLCGTEPNTSTS